MAYVRILNPVGTKHANDLKSSMKQVEGRQTKALLFLAGLTVHVKGASDEKCQAMIKEAVALDEEIGNYCHAAALILSRGKAIVDSQI